MSALLPSFSEKTSTLHCASRRTCTFLRGSPRTPTRYRHNISSSLRSCARRVRARGSVAQRALSSSSSSTALMVMAPRRVDVAHDGAHSISPSGSHMEKGIVDIAHDSQADSSPPKQTADSTQHRKLAYGLLAIFMLLIVMSSMYAPPPATAENRRKRQNMQPPRIELGSPAWQARILPLDHGCMMG